MKPQGNTTEEVPQIEPAELKARLDAGADVTLVDVREPFEWEIANLEAYGALLLPLGTFAEEGLSLDPADEIVVYCRSGGRSASAVQFLRAAGYSNVHNLRGGIRAWSQQIDPSLPLY